MDDKNNNFEALSETNKLSFLHEYAKNRLENKPEENAVMSVKSVMDAISAMKGLDLSNGVVKDAMLMYLESETSKIRSGLENLINDSRNMYSVLNSQIARSMTFSKIESPSEDPNGLSKIPPGSNSIYREMDKKMNDEFVKRISEENKANEVKDTMEKFRNGLNGDKVKKCKLNDFF